MLNSSKTKQQTDSLETKSWHFFAQLSLNTQDAYDIWKKYFTSEQNIVIGVAYNTHKHSNQIDYLRT